MPASPSRLHRTAARSPDLKILLGPSNLQRSLRAARFPSAPRRLCPSRIRRSGEERWATSTRDGHRRGPVQIAGLEVASSYWVVALAIGRATEGWRSHRSRILRRNAPPPIPQNSTDAFSPARGKVKGAGGRLPLTTRPGGWSRQNAFDASLPIAHQHRTKMEACRLARSSPGRSANLRIQRDAERRNHGEVHVVSFPIRQVRLSRRHSRDAFPGGTPSTS